MRFGPGFGFAAAMAALPPGLVLPQDIACAIDGSTSVVAEVTNFQDIASAVDGSTGVTAEVTNDQNIASAIDGSTSVVTALTNFKPSDISGLTVWFDMQDSTKYTNTSGAVSDITNKASGVVWSQGTASARPAINATGINSRNAMDPDGSNDGIKSTEAAVVAVLKDNHDYTLFIVGQTDDLSTVTVMFGAGNSGQASNGTKRFGINSTGAGRWTQRNTNDAAGTSGADSAGSTDLNPHVLMWRSASNAFTIQKDNGAADPSTTVTAGTTTPDQVALFFRPSSTGVSFFNGKCGEVVLYDSALSSGNADKVARYLGTKWGITVA